MPLLIDGYNLLHATGIVGRGLGPGGLERSRRALLNFIAAALDPREAARTTVVFDAADAPPGLPRIEKHAGITVRYASSHPDADTLIEELICRESAPRRLTVVSSDHRLHRAARRRKAKALDSDAWFADMCRRRARGGAAGAKSAKPTGPLTEAETDFWLAEFAGDDARPEHAAPDEAFPPEYLERLDEELGEPPPEE